MSDIQCLQLRQRRLLQDWLLAGDGEKRFVILNELRTVEKDLVELTRQHHAEPTMIRKFAVSQ